MRTLILAVAVALTAATRYETRETISESIFRPGKEYVYRYESQVLSGIRTLGNQMSGLKIHANVKLQIHRDGNAILKMNRVKVLKVNDEVEITHQHEMLTDDQLTLVTGEQGESLMEQLVKPIKFRLDEGEIREVKVERTDKLWSINIKKGLLSMLQLKLSGKTSIVEPETSSYIESSRSRSSRLFDITSFSNRRTSSRLENIFKVMEVDVNGECETKYVIQGDRSEDYSSSSDMIVTKIKNFDNCLTKSSVQQGLFADLHHYPSERNLIEPTMEGEYRVSGDRHHFLIKSAKVHAKYSFRPYGPEGGHVSTTVTQRLHLEGTEEISRSLEGESFVTDKHGLKMEIPRELVNHNGETEDYEQLSTGEWKQLIETKLDELIASIYPTMHETSARQLMYLNLILRKVPRRDLLSIIKSFSHNSGSKEIHRKREILLDLLPTVPSEDAVKVIAELIRDGTIHGIRAQLTIGAMSLTVKPSPEVVKTLMDLYKEVKTVEHVGPTLRHMILLSVGTVSNQLIAKMRRIGRPIPEVIAIIEEVSQELITMLTETNKDKTKILVLKTMGNMGSKELIPAIKATIEETSLPVTVRAQAIFALRKFTGSSKKLVQPILLSVYMDQRESHRLRTAAFIVLKSSVPTFTTLQLIANSLREEPSTQVKTFVYSSLVCLANKKSHIPELDQLSKNARKILKLIPAIPVGILDSKDFCFGVYSEKLDMGALWSTHMIKSKHRVPENVVFSFFKTIFGNGLHAFEVGVEGKGVETLMKRLIGPYGLLKDFIRNKAVIYDLFKPLTRSELPHKFKEFINKKSYLPRTDEDLNAMWYTEILGQELMFQEFDKESIEWLIRNAISRAPRLIELLREGINVDVLKSFALVHNSLVLPTPMGVPVSLNVSAGAVMKLDGYIKTTSLPNIRDFVMRRPFMTKKFELEANIKPSVSVEVFGYMGVDMRWIRTGTALKANLLAKLPVKGEIIIDPIESKFVAKYDMPKEELKVFKASIKPVMFTYYVPKTISRLPFTRTEMINIENTRTTENLEFEKEITCDLLGATWLIKVNLTKCTSKWCPYLPFTGKQEVAVVFTPNGEPKEVVFKVKKFVQDIYHEGMIDTSDMSDDTSLEQTGERTFNYRTAKREIRDDWDDFEPVDRDEYITTPRKVELLVELGLKGGYQSSERTIKGKLTWLLENNYLTHQLNLQVSGVIVNNYPPVKVMLNGLLRLPESLERFSHIVKPGETVGKMDLTWGLDSFKEHKLSGKVWKLASTRWMNEVMKEGLEYTNTRAIRYGAEVEFPTGINWRVKKVLGKALTLVKYIGFNYLKVGYPDTYDLHKVEVLGEFNVEEKTLSFILKTPVEVDYFMNIPIIPITSSWSCPWKRFWNPRLHDIDTTYFDDSNMYSRLHQFNNWDDEDINTFDRNYTSLITPGFDGVCKISNDKLLTFDGLPLLLPLHGDSDTSCSRCDVILAQDCSSNSLFTVTGSFKHGRWGVKIAVLSNIIELIPERSGDNFVLKVNDEEKHVSPSSPIVIKDNTELLPELSSPFNSPYLTPFINSNVLAVIEKIEDSLLVKLVEVGVKVIVKENNKIIIKNSPMTCHHGNLCGLCGDNNYDWSDDMTSLSSRRLRNSRSFVLDNVLPSSVCDASDYETKLNIRHQEFCKKEKTLKMERLVNGEDEICFSKDPVPVCKKSCIKERSTWTSIRMVCLPRGSSEARRLLSKYESGIKVLTQELSGLPVTLSEEFEIPDKCVSNY